MREYSEIVRDTIVYGQLGVSMDPDARRSAPGAAYVTFDAHRDGDFAPYVFRTDDFGRTWIPRVNGLPSGSANVIAEHHANPRLLFLGTEHALYASVDAGDMWVRFMPNLPTTLFDDIEIHPRNNDLVLGTHGRSIWILDDIAPLAEWSATVAAAPAHLFSVRGATIFQYWKDTSYRSQAAYAGQNPPFGAILDYYLARPANEAAISVTDATGRVVRRLNVPGSAGVIHRATWDLRHAPPPSLGGGGGGEEGGGAQALPPLAQPVGPRGPFVSPGTYTVTLEAGGARSTQRVVVKGDPLMPITLAQHREREEFLLQVQQDQVRAAEAAQRVRALPDSMRALVARLASARRDLDAIAGEFNGRAVRQGTLYPPTATHRQRYRAAQAALAEVLAALPAADR